MQRTLILLFTALLCIVIGLKLVGQLADNNMHGCISVIVVDGMSDNPLEGATVVIPEAKLSTVTDKYGKTNAMFITDIPNYSKQKGYGEVTVLVYCEGYTPYALFFAHVTKGEVTKEPIIRMFHGESEPFIIVESPNYEWARSLLEEYAPMPVQ